MITRECAECGKLVHSKTGRKTCCGDQGEYGSCAWNRQKKTALKYYHAHIKNIKKPQGKKKRTGVSTDQFKASDWLYYP